jgi:hypothetical protein
VAYGLCHCRTLHRDKGHRLVRCLSRRLHPPEERESINHPTQKLQRPGTQYAGPTINALLPEKWKHYAEINASYVQGGKFTPDEYAKHATKQVQPGCSSDEALAGGQK